MFVCALVLILSSGVVSLKKDEVLSLARKGLLDSAYSVSQRRLKDNPQDVFSLFMMGKLSFDGNESRYYFEKVIELASTGPEKEEALYRLAQFYFAKGQYHKAISFYRKVIEQYPEGMWITAASYWLGQACLNYGTEKPEYIDTAETQYINLLQSLSAGHYYYTMALEGLAKVRIEKDKWEAAFEAIALALETAPQDQRSHLLFLAVIATGNLKDTVGQKYYAGKLISEYPHSLEATGLKRERSLLITSANSDKNMVELSGYVIQLGAFLSVSNAEKALNDLKLHKFKVFIVKESRGEQKRFLIHTSVFPTREKADHFGETVLKPKEIPYYIVKKN
jgi:tetratricopeptide (TPR) repeat protein